MLIANCRFFTSCLLAFSIGLIGCGGSAGPAVKKISGTVTFDGDTLESGAISFVSTDGKVAPAVGVITDGAYTVEVPLGPKRVEIRAPKVVGQRNAYDTPDSPKIDLFKEMIPEKYNTHSELKRDITTGDVDGDFELKSASAK